MQALIHVAIHYTQHFYTLLSEYNVIGSYSNTPGRISFLFLSTTIAQRILGVKFAYSLYVYEFCFLQRSTLVL